MARLARGEYLDPHTTQIVHTVHRCVRRAFLCGRDPLTGNDYEHRRQWIRDRLELLASVFAIDCLTFTVMSNHIHLILRSRPDIVRTWSDEQVARRWLRLFPKRRTSDGGPAEPTETELNMIMGDPRRVAELRVRLSDISWWMRTTAENIARRANRQDDCTGHFWEGRYHAKVLLDEASILACAMYVDLNPIRAAMAETPEGSGFTGAQERIRDLQRSRPNNRQAAADNATIKDAGSNRGTNGNTRTRRHRSTRTWERSGKRRHHSGWMSPLEIDEQADPVGADASACGRRASLKGFLSMPLRCYLELLDWTGRQIGNDGNGKKKRGTIPPHLAPILQRIGITPRNWCRLVARFDKLFARAAGGPKSIADEAQRRKQNWMHAPGCLLLDATGKAT